MPARTSNPTAGEEDNLMNTYLDQLVARSIAHEREHELQQALRQQRGARAARRRGDRHVAVSRQHSLRARLAHIWAVSQ